MRRDARSCSVVLDSLRTVQCGAGPCSLTRNVHNMPCGCHNTMPRMHCAVALWLCWCCVILLPHYTGLVHAVTQGSLGQQYHCPWHHFWRTSILLSLRFSTSPLRLKGSVPVHVLFSIPVDRLYSFCGCCAFECKQNPVARSTWLSK